MKCPHCGLPDRGHTTTACEEQRAINKKNLSDQPKRCRWCGAEYDSLTCMAEHKKGCPDGTA
jgi:hypothetical protein